MNRQRAPRLRSIPGTRIVSTGRLQDRFACQLRCSVRSCLLCRARAVTAVPPSTTDLLDDLGAAPAMVPPRGELRIPPAGTGTKPRGPIANPLWAIPLSKLSATRERPIFSPTRRPPPPAVIAPAVAPLAKRPVSRPPLRPELTLIGTVIGSTEKHRALLNRPAKPPSG